MDREAFRCLQRVWDSLYWEDQPQRADLIVGFGCADPSVGERAAKLYLDGCAPLLVFSGGLGKGTANRLKKSEAEVYADAAAALGVPSKDILLETRSTNTGENIAFTRALLARRGIAPKTVLAVHQPNMGRRIRATLQKQWAQDGVRFLIAPGDRSLRRYLDRLTACGVSEQEMVSNIVGDFQRMDVYARLGYQTPCEMPPDAWDAFHALVGMGYDRYVIREETR